MRIIKKLTRSPLFSAFWLAILLAAIAFGPKNILTIPLMVFALIEAYRLSKLVRAWRTTQQVLVTMRGRGE